MFALASTVFFVALAVSVLVIYCNIMANMPRIEQVIAQRNGAGLKERVIYIDAVRSTGKRGAVVLAFPTREKAVVMIKAELPLQIAA
jgi:hypothetical protein